MRSKPTSCSVRRRFCFHLRGGASRSLPAMQESMRLVRRVRGVILVRNLAASPLIDSVPRLEQRRKLLQVEVSMRRCLNQSRRLDDRSMRVPALCTRLNRRNRRSLTSPRNPNSPRNHCIRPRLQRRRHSCLNAQPWASVVPPSAIPSCHRPEVPTPSDSSYSDWRTRHLVRTARS